VNGHVLGADNVWHPLTPAQATSRPARGYWKRYSGRWRKTYLILAVFGVLITLGSSKATGLVLVLDILGAATFTAAIIASLINLVSVGGWQFLDAGTTGPRNTGAFVTPHGRPRKATP